MSKKRLAWVSPLPGSNANEGDAKEKKKNEESCAAYVSKLILPALRFYFDIEVFSNGSEQFLDFPSYNFLRLAERDDLQPFDATIYQLEDLSSSAFVRAQLGLFPGIVWFHSFVLGDSGPEALFHNPWEVNAMRLKGADAAWLAPRQELPFRGPRAIREGALAAATFFSSYWQGESFRSARAEFPEIFDQKCPSYLMPIPVARLQLPEVEVNSKNFRLAMAGSSRIEHRAHKVLEAISTLENIEILWCAPLYDHDSAMDLIAEFGVKDKVTLLALTPAIWQETLLKADCACHLSFSIYSTLEPYLSISLVAGSAVIVSDFAMGQEAVGENVWKVQLGEGEVLELRYLFSDLLGRWHAASGKRQIVSRPEQQALHDAPRIAREIALAVEECFEHLKEKRGAWKKLYNDAERDLRQQLEQSLPPPSWFGRNQEQ